MPTICVAERVIAHCISVCFSIFSTTLYFGEGHVISLTNGLCHFGLKHRRGYLKFSLTTPSATTATSNVPDGEPFSAWVPEWVM